MDKNEVIKRIIEVQTEKLNKGFVQVAKEENLKKLNIGELYHILFISEQVSQG